MMNFPLKKTKSFLSNCQSHKGQIVVEYVLLLVVVVGIAALLTSTLVSRDPSSPGALVNKWKQIITTIGADVPDSTN